MECGSHQLWTETDHVRQKRRRAEPSEQHVFSLGASLHNTARRLWEVCSSVSATFGLGPRSEPSTTPGETSEDEVITIISPAPQDRWPTRKRSQSPDPVAPERCIKRRRLGDDADYLSAPDTELRHEPKKLQRLVVKTEKAAMSAAALSQALMSDLERLATPNTHVTRSTVERSEVEDPPSSTQQQDPKLSVKPPVIRINGGESDLKAVVAALRQMESDAAKGTPNGETMDDKLHSYYRALLSFFCGEDATCCTCPRIQSRANPDTERLLRPRMGVDEQGHAFDDRSPCPPPPSHDPRRRFQLTKREQALRLHLDSYRPAQAQLARGGFGTMPMPIQRRTAPDSEWAPLYASFGEIPYTTLLELHRRRNWCAYCEQKAMRTLPRWVAHAKEFGYEGGKMVFVNYSSDALIEWDDEERRWRHMVLHHHRWIPFEEWEGRQQLVPVPVSMPQVKSAPSRTMLRSDVRWGDPM